LDAILLAGGYATRLYPLTVDRPKALLPVGGRPILDYIVDALEAADEIDRMFLVTNDKFAGHFSRWAAARGSAKPLAVLSDGTVSNEVRLGAIGDVQFVLDHADVDVSDGLYVLGTDNIARFDIMGVVRLSRRSSASAVFACRVSDPERLHRVGVVVVDETGRITDFEEKPRKPKTGLGVPPFYVYTSEAAGLIRRYLSEGNDPDAPGHLVGWMIRHCPVYACREELDTYDIGTLASYEAVCRQFERSGRGEGASV